LRGQLGQNFVHGKLREGGGSGVKSNNEKIMEEHIYIANAQERRQHLQGKEKYLKEEKTPDPEIVSLNRP